LSTLIKDSEVMGNTTAVILSRLFFLGTGPQISMCPRSMTKPNSTAHFYCSFNFHGEFNHFLLWPVPVTREIFIMLKLKEPAQGSASSTPSL